MPCAAAISSLSPARHRYQKGRLPKGRLGREFTTDDGYRFARSAALDLVAVVRAELGSLNRVARVVEIQGS